MPDFNTRKPQEPNEPNRLGISLLADKLRALLIASKHRTPLIVNRSRSLLTAGKQRVVLIADGLRSLLVAHRLRTLLISGGILFFVVAVVPVGLLIYSSSGMGDQQQEARQGGRIVSGMQSRLMEDIKVDPDLSREIVFGLSTIDSSGFEIWTMNSNGSELRQLTDTAESSNQDPARSPDLKKIAFTRRVEKTIEEESASASARSDGLSTIQIPSVFVMNANGSEQVKLLDRVGAQPDWSPDSKLIVFSSGESWSSSGISMDGECELYVVNADGSGTPRRLTNCTRLRK
jgi:Tol biopolymer transport system component